MTKSKSAQRIFVSFSSADHHLVKSIVDLMRLMRGGTFWAPDSIERGAKWQKELERAIGEARALLLIWCEHSSRSSHVQWEYQYAIALKKPIVPAILDETPLPPELQVYQRIDIRALTRHLPMGSTLRNSTGNYEARFAGLEALDYAPKVRQSKMVLTPPTMGLVGVALALLAFLRPLPPLPDNLAHLTNLVNALLFALAVSLVIGSIVRACNWRPRRPSASVTNYDDDPSPKAVVAKCLEISHLLVHDHRAVDVD